MPSCLKWGCMPSENKLRIGRKCSRGESEEYADDDGCSCIFIQESNFHSAKFFLNCKNKRPTFCICSGALALLVVVVVVNAT